MLFARPPPPRDKLLEVINDAYRIDEASALRPLLVMARLEPERSARVLERARQLTAALRKRLDRHNGIERLLHEYDLSNEEGIVLMCLAEALLRIPDEQNRKFLIREKIIQGHWDHHIRHDNPLLVNASAWGLLISGRFISMDSPAGVLRRLLRRAGERVLDLALNEAMEVLAHSFILGADIDSALRHSRHAGENTRYSFDCLGEAAQTVEDVEEYMSAYETAIARIAGTVHSGDGLYTAPGVSIKLSALHPRYRVSHAERVFDELLPRIRHIVHLARDAGISITIDAEECERLELSLLLFQRLIHDPLFTGWSGLGLALQSYQKRAMPVLRWLQQQAMETGRTLPLRLVKGAYWDSEIKRAQELGLDNYPVFTRKNATDVGFLACARYLLSHPDSFYPQIATHNAFSVAYVMELASAPDRFEFQRLHGMAESLYPLTAELYQQPITSRIYGPVGSYEKLLPYLVRRLLENGANSSFINQLGDLQQPVELIVTDPVLKAQQNRCSPHPAIPKPAALYGKQRRNSTGHELSDYSVLQQLDQALAAAAQQCWEATPIIAGERPSGPAQPVTNPADRRQQVGNVVEAEVHHLEQAMASAAAAAQTWDRSGGTIRANYLKRAAELLEEHTVELAYLVIREAGKPLVDALNEVREAVDACRYYARQAAEEFSRGAELPGPTGEQNTLWLHGRGVFACISPWNFPVAIFCGQIAAALAAGNCVVAKPARLTPVTAWRCVTLFHEAGIPVEVLHLLPGSAGVLASPLLRSSELAGVAFTGSTAAAHTIQSQLAANSGPIRTLIAETGGLNMMIADSSALLEQVVDDVITSAFNSAGQRCSALRLLFVQREIAGRLIERLVGAMEELHIGDPILINTDIGPLIDANAVDTLERHSERMGRQGRLLKRLSLPQGCDQGSYFAPHLFELSDSALLHEEVFGPALHLVRYEANALEQVVDRINASGYGLTLGVHSRLESTWQQVQQRARVGNLYINRNMVGAVVGVQPFGGEGLSGTGPKAGGPHYLHRFATERTVTVNTTASGGNASLLTLDDNA